MNVWHRFKMWVAGRSRFSACWLGQHAWDMPGGHCEKCGRCDEFFHEHHLCIRRSSWLGDYKVKP